MGLIAGKVGIAHVVGLGLGMGIKIGVGVVQGFIWYRDNKGNGRDNQFDQAINSVGQD